MKTKSALQGKTTRRGLNKRHLKKYVTAKLLVTALAALTFGGAAAVTDVGIPVGVAQAADDRYYIQPIDEATNETVGSPISVKGTSGQSIDAPRVVEYKAKQQKVRLPQKPATIRVAYTRVTAMVSITVNYFDRNNPSTEPLDSQTINEIPYNYKTDDVPLKNLGSDYSYYHSEVATELDGLTFYGFSRYGFGIDNQSDAGGTAVVNVYVNGPKVFNDFKPKDITYKVGNPKPVPADYVDKDDKGNTIDPAEVKIDDSAVTWDQPGSYQVPVTYGDATHNATVTVQAADKPQPVQYNYTVRTIDGQGRDLGRGYSSTGASGSTISAPTISGYTLTSANNVALTSNGQQITFTYRLNSSTPPTPVTPTNPGAADPTTPNNPNPGTTNDSNATMTPVEPTNNVPTNAAQKGAVVYAVNKIGFYSSPDFSKANRKGWYVKKPRVARPMFVVTGYERSQNGALRYRVRDVNHLSKTAGQTGYITANWKYVRPVYYAAKHSTITVINPRGVNAYRKANLTGKVKAYKQGTVLKVKGIVKHNLTTRYVLTNGNYVTANRKLVNMGRHKQVKTIKTKQTINRYRDVNLTKQNKRLAKNKKLKVYNFDCSQKNDVTKQGALRYRVAGGYITGHTKYVKVYR